MRVYTITLLIVFLFFNYSIHSSSQMKKMFKRLFSSSPRQLRGPESTEAGHEQPGFEPEQEQDEVSNQHQQRGVQEWSSSSNTLENIRPRTQGSRSIFLRAPRERMNQQAESDPQVEQINVALDQQREDYRQTVPQQRRNQQQRPRQRPNVQAERNMARNQSNTSQPERIITVYPSVSEIQGAKKIAEFNARFNGRS